MASRKVFETPELLNLVCSYAEKWTHCSLLRTTKSGFLAAAPFVWEEVDGVINLLNVLPNMKIGISKKTKEIVSTKCLFCNALCLVNHNLP